MLRFDIPPVWSNVIRWEAFLTFVLCGLAVLVTPWVLAILVAQGYMRGFFGHHREPVNALWVGLFAAKGWAGKQENAGAKMFAAKLLFLASAVALGLYLAGSVYWVIPCYILIVFSFLEWAFSFCAGCWAYTFWYRTISPKI